MSIRSISILCLLLATTSFAHIAVAETVAVIGTGRVGGALGPRLGEAGHQVIYGSRHPGSKAVADLVARTHSARAMLPPAAAEEASIIVLAVPWRAVESVVASLGSLDGKIIIDVTNALTIGEDGFMALAVETSAGELIQSWLPDSHVVKAFNTVGYRVMADPNLAGGPVTIPIAGNHTEAKLKVASLVTSLGFESADVGPMKHAHHLEGLAVLYMVPYLTGKPEEVFELYLRKNKNLRSDQEVRPAQ